MAPGKYYRECKQCFIVINAKNFRRHLSSHEHQVKACVLAMGRKILSSCPRCKNTKIVQIRAQCIKCCKTLEEMYDAILKPLEISNKITRALSAAPQKLKVSKLITKSLSRPHKPSTLNVSSSITGSSSRACKTTSKPTQFSSMSTNTSHINQQLSSQSCSDRLFDKSHNISDSKVLLKPSTMPHIKQSNKQSFRKSHHKTSASKASSMTTKTPFLNQQWSLRTSDDCCSYTNCPKTSASKDSSSNVRNSSFDQHKVSQSSRQSCENPLEIPESKVFSRPDKPFSWNKHYYPPSSDNAFEKVDNTTESNDTPSVTTYPSVRLTTSKCRKISIKVVQNSPGVSEYIFKLSKFTSSDVLQQNAPSSSVVQPDTKDNESVTRLDLSTTTQNNLHDPRSIRSFEQEFISLFPDVYNDELKTPLSPMTTDDLLTTLSPENEFIGPEETTVYDDWFLATDLKLSDSQDPTEHITGTQNEEINKPKIKCRELSSLMP